MGDFMQVVPPANAGERPAAPAPSGQAGPAEQAIKMIQTGFQQMAKMLQAAGDKLDPQDIELFQAAVKATDDFLQALMGDLQQQGPAAPQRPAPGGPMPANANAKAAPSPQY
jgi:hypothetical protein